MNITTDILNNIENKIINSQPDGISIINAIGDGIDKPTTLNVSYNDLISLLENKILPIIKFNSSTNETIEINYGFIRKLYVEENIPYCYLNNGMISLNNSPYYTASDLNTFLYLEFEKNSGSGGIIK